MKERVKIIISYLMPSAIVLILASVILEVQGIWPFGSETIDFYDMAQQVAAEYTQIWDEMHGAKSVIFDWYQKLGRGIAGGTYLSLGNLILYFIPRNMILQGFSIIVVFRMMCMAFTMRILLKSEASECSDFYSVILSVGYGFCGYVLMQYTIPSWLNHATIAPLLIMFTQKLLRDGKVKGFIACVALLLLESFYVPVMVLLFVFLISGLYSLIHRDKKIYIFRLGYAVFAGILLSAWGWIPKVLSAAGGQRFANEAESGLINQYLKILTHVRPDYSSRWWSLLGVSFAAAVTIVGIYKDIKRKNIKRLYFVCGSFVIVLAQLLFENIQLFWHFGSYVNYPVRSGFLIYIVFAMAAATYAKEVLTTESEVLNADKKTKPVKVYRRGVLIGYEEEVKTGLNIYIGAGFVIMAILTSAGLFWYQANPGMSIYTVFRVSMLAVIGSFLVYLFLVIFKSGRFAKLSVFLIFAEIIFYGVLLIGKPTYITGYSEEPEQEGEYVRIAYQLQDAFDIYESRLDRIKNPDTSLNTNYGILLRRATLSDWTLDTKGEMFSSASGLGNSTQYTRILDSGGTVFSDALYHVTQVVSCIPQNDTLYKKVDSAKITVDHSSGERREYGLYNSRFILPFGTIITDDKCMEKNTDGTIAGTYNALYQAMVKPESCKSSIAENITSNIEGELLDFAGKNNVCHIEGRKAVYITGRCVDAEFKNTEIVVNDKIIPVPSIHDLDNTKYPAHFNNNCLLMGCFADEDITFRVDLDKSIEAYEYGFEVFTIDLDELKNLCEYYAGSEQMTFTAGNRNFEASVNGKSGEYLMLPIAYSDDYKITVNGFAVKPAKVNALLMAIPLMDGGNRVQMVYFPKTMKLGIVVSLVTLLLVIIIYGGVLILKKKRPGMYAGVIVDFLTVENKVDKILSIAYPAVWGIFMLGMYVIPAIYGVYYYMQ